MRPHYQWNLALIVVLTVVPVIAGFSQGGGRDSPPGTSSHNIVPAPIDPPIQHQGGWGWLMLAIAVAAFLAVSAWRRHHTARLAHLQEEADTRHDRAA